MRFFDRLWVLDSVDSVAAATWHELAAPGQLRSQYLSALSHLQTWTKIQWAPEGIAVTFDNPGAVADFVRREAWGSERQDRLFRDDQRTGLRNLIRDGLGTISAVNRDLHDLIELTIG